MKRHWGISALAIVTWPKWHPWKYSMNFSANVTGIVFFFLPVGFPDFARNWGYRQGMSACSVCFIHAVHPWLFMTLNMPIILGLPMCWRCDCVKTKILQHLVLISSWGYYHWAGTAWKTWPLTEMLMSLSKSFLLKKVLPFRSWTVV